MSFLRLCECKSTNVNAPATTSTCACAHVFFFMSVNKRRQGFAYPPKCSSCLRASAPLHFIAATSSSNKWTVCGRNPALLFGSLAWIAGDAVHLRSVGCAILPRLFSPARWLRDQPPLLSALQYRSRIAMRTWRRTLPKRMTILHALLRRGCSWKPHCLNKFETAWSCLLFCFFSLLCCHHLHT